MTQVWGRDIEVVLLVVCFRYLTRFQIQEFLFHASPVRSGSKQVMTRGILDRLIEGGFIATNRDRSEGRRRPAESLCLGHTIRLARYTFRDDWYVRAPRDEVFMHIARASTYPRWWPGWEHIDVEGSDDPRVGARASGIVRSPFGYRLRLEVSIAELERPRRLLTISKGDLAGTGLWEFDERDGTTHARWTWTVESHHPLLTALEPVAKKLFEASHNYVSSQGHAGLRRYLEPASFDPARVATLEAAGWRAYYAREWSKMLYLMVALAAEQFRMPPREAMRAAYYATRGAVAFKPVVPDEDLVLRCYERFYEIARRHSGLRFRPREAARHEMRYWQVHRRTAAGDEKRELTDVLAALHAELFSLSPDAARESAVWRARAAATVDRITSGRSDDVERDWATIDADLGRCYNIVSREMPRSRAQGSVPSDRSRGEARRTRRLGPRT